METINLFRAMSEIESLATRGSPAFIRRFKWFSTSGDFIRDRVMDGSFNNSGYKPERYTVVRCLVIPRVDLQYFESEHGGLVWRLDRRRVQQVHWLEIV